MKHTIHIDDILFPDGIVEKYEFDGSELRLLFKDSSNSRFLLAFSGGISFTEQGSIGYDIFRRRLEKHGSQTRLRFLDDDLKEMFCVTFDQCIVSVIE